MTGEIVNLRRARKARSRAEQASHAADNRIAFGTPKALRRSAEAERDRAARALDNQKLEGSTHPARADD